MHLGCCLKGPHQQLLHWRHTQSQSPSQFSLAAVPHGKVHRLHQANVHRHCFGHRPKEQGAKGNQMQNAYFRNTGVLKLQCLSRAGTLLECACNSWGPEKLLAKLSIVIAMQPASTTLLGASRSQSKAIDRRRISKQMASGRDDDTALVYPSRQCLQITVGGWPIYVVSRPG